ncbi:hypothetical protein Pgy4_34781, partial [Pseudomonas savastanoi pv. glycinea str. race 4]
MPSGAKQIESHAVASSMAGTLESAYEEAVKQTAHTQPRAGRS